MRILSIETSCDDTAMAVVDCSGKNLDDIKIIVEQNLISSQTEIHRHWGGVVPNLAKREHLKSLPLLLSQLEPSPYNLKPDLLAVTVGPGLEPALWTGIEFAKKLSEELDVPIFGAKHLEGHLYSFLL